MITKSGMKLYYGNEPNPYKKELGEIRPLLLERKTVFLIHKKPEHWFVKDGGFAFNNELLGWLENYGINEIRINYHGKTNELYAVTIETIRKYGKQINYEEPQTSLNLRYFINLFEVKNTEAIK